MALLAGLAGGLDSLGTSMQAKEKEQRRDQREIAKEDRNAERERIKAKADALREENLIKLRAMVKKEYSTNNYSFLSPKKGVLVRGDKNSGEFETLIGGDAVGGGGGGGGAGGVPDPGGAVPSVDQVLDRGEDDDGKSWWEKLRDAVGGDGSEAPATASGAIERPGGDLDDPKRKDKGKPEPKAAKPDAPSGKKMTIGGKTYKPTNAQAAALVETVNAAAASGDFTAYKKALRDMGVPEAEIPAAVEAQKAKIAKARAAQAAPPAVPPAAPAAPPPEPEVGAVTRGGIQRHGALGPPTPTPPPARSNVLRDR